MCLKLDEREAEVSVSIERATMGLGENDLPDMVLGEEDLMPLYGGFALVREGELDNRALAERGFEDATERRFQDAGRIAGYVREFASPGARLNMDGADLMVGSVAHLFDAPESVSGWMRDIFLKDFMDNAGVELEEGQKVVEAKELRPKGFFDDAVALKATYDNYGQIISSTVVDFRVGRILGVAYVTTVGDHTRLDEVTALGISMEKLVVAAALNG